MYGKRCKHTEQRKANVASRRNCTKSWQVLKSLVEEKTSSLCVLMEFHFCLYRALWNIQRKAISRCPGGGRDGGTPRQEREKEPKNPVHFWCQRLYMSCTLTSHLCDVLRELRLKETKLIVEHNKMLINTARSIRTVLAFQRFLGLVQLLQFAVPMLQAQA